MRAPGRRDAGAGGGRGADASESDATRCAAGLPIADALVRAGLATSKGDARRGLAANGFSVNGESRPPRTACSTADDLLPGGVMLLRKGKRTWAALRVLA